MKQGTLILVGLATLALLMGACAGRATVEEYVCALREASDEFERAIDHSRTNGEARERLREAWDAMPSPPTVYREYHDSLSETLSLWERALSALPEDGRFNLLSRAALSGVADARLPSIGEVVRALPDDARAVRHIRCPPPR